MRNKLSLLKRKMSLLLIVTLTLIGLTSANQKSPITIFMIGDSTMANKPLEKDNQERGWGQMLSGFFTDDVRIDNHAVNGRSSLSFINEGRWDKVLEKIQPGDYVFIQFGHNDEKPQENRHTEPGSTFDANLRRFCEEARSKGGIPVLFNSIVRRAFFVNENAVVEDDNFGKAITLKQEGDTLIETHILTRPDGSIANYLESPKAVARELGVAFVDMNRITHDLVQGMGPEASKRLYCWIPKHTNLASPEGREDNTHLNIYGARMVCKSTIDAIGEAVPALKPFIRHYDYVVAQDGSGDFFTVQEAVNAVPDYNKQEIRILLQPGTYHEKLIIPESKENITLIGKTEGECIITFDDYAAKPNSFGKNMGTSGSASVYVYAPDFTAEGITFCNTASAKQYAQDRGGVGQAVAILVKGDRAVFRKCRFLGHQDTLYAFGQKYASQSRQYYEDCYIEGTVDFIFGWATAVFNRCTIHCLANGYVTAAATPQGQEFGYVFHNCKITAEAGVQVFLGRPWRDYSHVVYLNCELPKQILPAGWNDWGKPHAHRTAYYAEYQSKGEGARPKDRCKWSHQLTDKMANKYAIENVLKGDDNWNPLR